MKYDIILSGVGGQGVLSLAAVIAAAAVKAGFQVRQSEVHGMAQRGGAVMAHMRIADEQIHSDLIGRGQADMILSMEPLESLRYLSWLSPEGILVSSVSAFKNIPNYPDAAALEKAFEDLPVKRRLVDEKTLAREAGSAKSGNMVIVGAASKSLPVKMEHLKAAVDELFSAKGNAVVEVNYKALDLGRQAS